MDQVTITVNTTEGQMPVPGGADFLVDWGDGDGSTGPGLAVLDKPESDNTAVYVAYFPPGYWKGVVKSE